MLDPFAGEELLMIADADRYEAVTTYTVSKPALRTANTQQVGVLWQAIDGSWLDLVRFRTSLAGKKDCRKE